MSDKQSFETLVDLLQTSCRRYATSPLFGSKTGAGWEWITYAQFQQLVTNVEHGLLALGVGKGERIAIIANNRVEWAAAAYGSYGVGAAFVPMYESQPAAEWQYILGDSEAVLVFCGTTAIARRVAELQPTLPALRQIIDLQQGDSQPGSFRYLCQQPRPAQGPVRPTGTDLAGVIYTSGTTGNPKGVLLTHRNVCSNIEAVREVLSISGRSLSFLPWAHSFGQTAELHTLIGYGCAIAINDDVASLLANLTVVKPSVLVAVPRIFNRIYERVNQQMQGKPRLIQRLFTKGLEHSQARKDGKALSLSERVVLGLADVLVFRKIRERFGGELKFVVSGSAALSPTVARFIDALGIVVYEGYGLTETSPVVSVNHPGAQRIGSVGKPVPGVRVVIDFAASAEPEEGEIIVYGPNVMQGYYNLPEETQSVMTADGGFRTGDLGRFDADGFLYITGRIKEQYKLENGKYVAPAPLEELLKLSPYVLSVLLYGANHPYNVALVVPEPERLEEWAKQHGMSSQEALTHDAFKTHVLSELTAQSADFRSYERPKKVLLVAEDFSLENGMLTPSLKPRRKEILARYQSALDALYK